MASPKKAATAAAPALMGFYSFKHLPKPEQDQVNKLRRNLEYELETITGRKIVIWQDIEEVEWGQQWGKAIEKGLEDAAFFIPVITPGYLFSQYCRGEFETFAAYERKRNRTDLILPLVYVRPDAFDDEEERKKDFIVKLCLERQWVNWEDLRHLGDEGIEYRTRLTLLAKRIRELLKTLPAATPANKTPPPTKTAKKKETQKKLTLRKNTKSSATAISEASTPSPSSDQSSTQSPPPAPRTLYVNRLGGTGIYQSIGKALEAAQGGEYIHIAPGHYAESIQLTKPVVLVGEGNLGDVTISASGANAVKSSSSFGRLQNLTLRQTGSGKYFTVSVTAGSLEIDGCDLTSASLSCLGVKKDAESRVRRCKIHGSPQCGVGFLPGSRGSVDECEIFENGSAGVFIDQALDVVVRACKIRDGKDNGLRTDGEGRVLIEDNLITGNHLSGIQLIAGSEAIVRRNQIHGNTEAGIRIQAARGTLLDNEIHSNGLSGIIILEGSGPSVSNNLIYDNGQAGLYIYAAGEGVIENNQVTGNKHEGACITEGSKPQMRKNHFQNNARHGITIEDNGGGLFEGNTFKDNKKGDKSIDTSSQANVQWKD